MLSLIRSLLKLTFALCVAVLSPSPSLAILLVGADGIPQQGTIVGIVDDVVQFQKAGEFSVYPLEHILEVRVEEGVTGDELQLQKDWQEKLQPLINTDALLRQQMNKKHLGLLREGSYNELEGIAADMLQKKQRSMLGVSQLIYFYEGFVADLSKRDIGGLEQRLALVDEWMEASPNSDVPIIAKMEVLDTLAWAHRGSGFSNTVAESAWPLFRGYQSEILDLAKLIEERGVIDPTMYYAVIPVMKSSGVPKSEIRQLAIEVRQRFGLDAHITRVMGLYVARWGGSPEKVGNVLEELSLDANGVQDLELYYRNATAFAASEKMSFAKSYNMNWEKTRQGFEIHAEQYPIIERDLHRMARLAWSLEDIEAATDYLSQTRGQWNFQARDVWGNKQLFERVLAAVGVGSGDSFLPIYKEFKTAGPEGQQILERHLESHDIDEKDRFGDTLLHIAAMKGDAEFLRMLLRRNASTSLFNNRGFNLLHVAAEYNQTEIVRSLIGMGADPGLGTQKAEQTAIHIAAEHGFAELVEELLETAPGALNEQDVNGATALHKAVVAGHENVVQVLLQQSGINLDLQANRQQSPIHLAVEQGFSSILTRLLVAGADPNVEDHFQRTALDLALQRANSRMAGMLRSNNATNSAHALDRNQIIQVEALLDQISQVHGSDPVTARRLIDQLLTMHPKNPLGLFYLAENVWRFGGNAALAVEHMTRAMELEPYFVEGYYWYARMAYDANKPEIYSPYFIRYAQIKPDSYNTRDLKNAWPHLLKDF